MKYSDIKMNVGNYSKSVLTFVLFTSLFRFLVFVLIAVCFLFFKFH